MAEREPEAGQAWNARAYAHNAAFVAELGTGVLELLDPKAGERILDLGCGDGALTQRIAAFGATVVGCDASRELIAAARGRGLDALHADGHALPFASEFDAVFSNAALHWMTRPNDVLAGVRRALRPRGRFVGEFGAHGNVAAIVTALRAVLGRRGIATREIVPWFFPTSERYAALLEANGFAVREIAVVPRPTILATGIEGWLATFASPFTSAIADADRPAALDEVRDLLAPALCDESGRWTADYVRLRFAAVRR